jgi:hypothetical protein
VCVIAVGLEDTAAFFVGLVVVLVVMVLLLLLLCCSLLLLLPAANTTPGPDPQPARPSVAGSRALAAAAGGVHVLFLILCASPP